jgi:hypothetical protein
MRNHSGFREKLDKSAKRTGRTQQVAAAKPNRYKSVDESALLKMLDAPPSAISAVRMRFQLLIFMRDGILISKGAPNRNKNISVLLDAAQQVISDHERFNKFFGAVTDAMDQGDT